jgi:hypothetical protein
MFPRLDAPPSAAISLPSQQSTWVDPKEEVTGPEPAPLATPAKKLWPYGTPEAMGTTAFQGMMGCVCLISYCCCCCCCDRVYHR